MLLFLGALSRGRFVSFSEMFLVAFVATLVHDFIFWKLGYRLGKLQKKKYLYFNLERFTNFLERIRPYAGIFIIFSKFAWNFNRIVLVSAGYINIPLKKIMKYSVVTAFLWPSLYMTIGFIFADQTDIFKQGLTTVGLLVVGILVFLILFELYIKKLVTRLFFSTTVEKHAHENHPIEK